MVKTIRVSDELHKSLEGLGNKGESFDALLKRLLDLGCVKCEH